MNGPEWLSGQMSSFRCPACGRPYGSTHVRLLAEREGLYFVDLECLACDSRTVAIVTVEVDDAEAVIADVGPGAPPGAGHAPYQRPPVSADDVIDMHRFLARFEGNVTQLLRAAASPLPRGAERG